VSGPRLWRRHRPNLDCESWVLGLGAARTLGLSLRVIIDQRASNCSSYRIHHRKSTLDVASDLHAGHIPGKPLNRLRLFLGLCSVCPRGKNRETRHSVGLRRRVSALGVGWRRRSDGRWRKRGSHPSLD
jgi:hypothetical protein